MPPRPDDDDDGVMTLASINPFRTAVPFWGQTSLISSICPQNGTAVLKGLIANFSEIDV